MFSSKATEKADVGGSTYWNPGISGCGGPCRLVTQTKLSIIIVISTEDNQVA